MHEGRQGSILRRAGPLMLARLGVAAVTFAIPMVLARVLLPDDYGTFKQAWLLSNTLFLVLPLGLNQSLVYFVPREPEKSRAWESHALLLTTALGGLAAGLLLACGPLVASAFHNPKLAALMPSIAAFTGFKLAASCFDLAFMARGRIKASAVVRVASEGFYTLCMLAGALATRTVAGAFVGVVIATFAKALACWIALAGRGLVVLPRDLRRQLSYALPFGAAFAMVIPQQQFHSYLVSASVTAAAFAVYSVGCFQLPIIDMLYTPVSEILQLGIAEHDAQRDNAGALALFREAVARLSFVFVPTMAVLAITAPVLIRFLFTDRYLGAVPIFRLAIVSIPMAALPLDGVMRARAQNRFMFRVAALKLALTVPLVWLGLRLFGPIGALGGWICAEESCRMILLHRAARLFGTTIPAIMPRELWLQIAAAALAAGPGALALHLTGGPLLVQLCATGLAFAAVYLAALRIMGVLPPLRAWIPQKKPAPSLIQEAA
ncbi:MAG TPA: oligosaccharide flippase family protein [Myxococcales bacterium]|nr:oligosaccharide flippase family protein [Myxococcales bacterium]